jgi:4-diphosphocytidyl-2-C-methyl-D-erythritol kinase
MPVDDRNLILTAANLLIREFSIKQGAEIHLAKKIPFPGGLGGGSSNAAMTLLALATLWNLPVKFDDLSEIGSWIGADVPFFFYGGTALGTGRGTTLSTLPDSEEKFIVIVTPAADISTAEAYEKLNASRLTKKGVKSILQICHDHAERLDSGQLELFNDFEKSVFRIKPEIGRVKKRLLNLGAEHALLSGSGASVFGVFENEEKQQIALDAFSADEGVRIFSVETISRSTYRKQLAPCKHLLPENS